MLTRLQRHRLRPHRPRRRGLRPVSAACAIYECATDSGFQRWVSHRYIVARGVA